MILILFYLHRKSICIVNIHLMLIGNTTHSLECRCSYGVHIVEEVAKDIVDEDADVQRIVIDNETTEIVSEAVDKLDDMYRDLIIMKY